MAGITATAVLASTFIGGLGVNTHIDFKIYPDPTIVADSISYLGVKNVRDSAVKTTDLTTWPLVAQRAGVKFDAFIQEGSPAMMQSGYAMLPQLAATGILNFIEGGNEEDDPYAISLGNSLAYTAGFQQLVFQRGRSLGIPVINMSFGQGWTAANDWKGNYDKVGDLAAYADYANAHTYPTNASGQPYATVVRLNRNANIAAVGRPVITTELGWSAANMSDADVMKNVLNGIFDCAKTGNAYTYIYALYDDASGKYGMMNMDGTPKPAGTALHNLTMLLGDTGTVSATPGSLTLNISGASGAEATYLMQKSDGSYWLSIWDEVDATHPITVTLASQASQVQLFDPVLGTTALQSVSNTTGMSFTLTDHPVLIRVVPPSPVAAVPANTIASFANNATLTGNAGTTSINAYGTGDTITGGSGTYSIVAFKGNNTVYGGSGAATIRVGGAGNKIIPGTGTNAVYDSGTNSAYTFNSIGSTTDIYGYVLEQGATLNMKPLMAGTQWNGDPATLGNYLKVTTANSNATVSVTPSGLAGGMSYPVVTLHGYGYLTYANLTPRLGL